MSDAAVLAAESFRGSLVVYDYKTCALVFPLCLSFETFSSALSLGCYHLGALKSEFLAWSFSGHTSCMNFGLKLAYVYEP